MRLSSQERELVAEVFDGMLPPSMDGRLFLGAREAGVVEFFETHLGFLPFRTRWALRVAVDAVGVYARFHPGGARGVLEGLADSQFYALREIITLLKSVVCMGYFTDARVRLELGLDLTLATCPVDRVGLAT